MLTLETAEKGDNYNIAFEGICVPAVLSVPSVRDQGFEYDFAFNSKPLLSHARSLCSLEPAEDAEKDDNYIKSL